MNRGPYILVLNFTKANNKNTNSLEIGNYMFQNLIGKENVKVLDIEVSGNYLDEIHAALNKYDYMKWDADFVLINDDALWTDLMFHDQNSFSYFNNVLKAFQINNHHSMLVNDIFSWTQNFASTVVPSIIDSMIKSDIVFATDFIWSIFVEHLKDKYTPEFIERIHNKVVHVPPPGFYRFETETVEKDYTKLRILWNHAVRTEKNFPEFVKIIQKFREKFPQVETEIHFTGINTTKLAGKLKGADIGKYICYGKLENIEDYKNVLRKCNMQISVSLAESFGISMAESIKFGLNMVGLIDCRSYCHFYGTKYAYRDDMELIDNMYRVFKDKTEREENYKYHLDWLNKLPSKEDYKKTIMSKMREILVNSLPKSEDTGLLTKMLNYIDKKGYATKKELYNTINFSENQTKFWPTYFYGLRKNGVELIMSNDVLYFVKDMSETELKAKLDNTTFNKFFI